MRTVGYIPKEGAEQKKRAGNGTGRNTEPPEPKDDGTGTPVPPEPPEPKDDPVKKGGKKE